MRLTWILVTLILTTTRVYCGCNAADGTEYEVQIKRADSISEPSVYLGLGKSETWKAVVYNVSGSSPVAVTPPSGSVIEWQVIRTGAGDVSGVHNQVTESVNAIASDTSSTEGDIDIYVYFQPPNPATPPVCIDHHKVTVVRLDLAVRLPPALDSDQHEFTEAEEDTPGSGAALTVNHDNDDKGTKWDITPGKVLTVDDDELAHLVIRLYPHDIDGGIVTLSTDAGVGELNLWSDRRKTLPVALPTDLTVATDFDDKTTHLENKDPSEQLFLEGAKPHVARLTASYVRDGTVIAEDVVLETTIGIDSISWKGKKNGRDGSDTLDNDPNWATYLTPQALRVFPERHVRTSSGSTSIDETPMDKVEVEVTLTDVPPVPINCYLLSFDVDDPSAENNVVDMENAVEDNRSADKCGKFAGSGNKRITLTFNGTYQCKTEYYPPQQPGDNIRVAGTLSPTLFMAGTSGGPDQVQNNDILLNTYGATPDGRNESKQVIYDVNILTASGATLANAALIESENCVTPTLTTWRFLHVEQDHMEKPDPWPADIVMSAPIPENAGTDVDVVISVAAGTTGFPDADVSLLDNYAPAYVQHVVDVPNPNKSKAFLRNATMEVSSYPDTVNDVEGADDFWKVQIFSAYDALEEKDFDNEVAALLGDTYSQPTIKSGCNIYLETIRDVANSGGASVVTVDAVKLTKRVVFHETLHRFAFRHPKPDATPPQPGFPTATEEGPLVNDNVRKGSDADMMLTPPQLDAIRKHSGMK